MQSQYILDLLEQMNEQMRDFFEHGQYEPAIEMGIKVCDLARRHLGGNHSIFAGALNNLALMYEKAGNYAEAEPIYLQAIEICRETLGEDDPDYATTVNGLAMLYRSMGNNVKAEPLYLEALEIRRAVLGEDEPEFARSLNNLADLYRTMGKYDAAEPLCQQAIKIQREVIGEEDPEYAQSLLNLAELYRETGNYTKAEPLYNQGIAILRAALGEAHPHFAISLNNLALLYQSQAKYAGAETLHRQSIEIQRKALGENHPYFAMSLNNLAELYQKMGNYKAAEPLYRQAIEVQREAVGEEHPYFAMSLNNLARLYQKQGNYKAAETLNRQAIEATAAAVGESHPFYAACIKQKAHLFHGLGDYVAAELLYRQAMEIHVAVFGKAHTGDLDSLAAVCAAMGDYPRAESLYHEAIDNIRSTLGEKHPELASSLNGLAEVYRIKGDYKATEALNRQAIEIQREALGEKHTDFAFSLTSMGWLYFEMGDHETAEQFCRQAVEITRTALGEQSQNYATSLNNLGGMYYAMGNYAKAGDLLIEAEGIRRAVLGAEHPDIAQSLSNLSQVFRELKDYVTAEQLCRQSIEIRRKILGENHPDFALDLSNLAILCHATGDYATAELLCSQALEIRRAVLGEEHPDFAWSIQVLAILYVATSRDQGALSLMQQVSRINDKTIGQMFSIGNESQRMGYLATIEGDSDLFLSLVSQRLSHSAIAGRAALDLILRRKAIAAEALAAQRDAVVGGKYEELRPKLRELTALRQQIARRTLAGPGAEGLSFHQQILAEWNARKEQLEAVLTRQIPETSLEQKFREADRQAVALALPEETSLVEFIRFDVFDFKAVPARGESQWKPACYLAFVLPAGKPDNIEMIDLGEAEPIDRMIATFREIITGEEEDRSDRGLGRLPSSARRVTGEDVGVRLRDAVFTPLLKAIGNRRRLMISPDGDLTRLPFEVLPTDDGQRLIDQYQISYLGAGRDVVRFGFKSNRKPARSLVAADPNFDFGGKAIATGPAAGSGRRSRDLNRDAMETFEHLPGTKLEGENIAAMLDAELWLEDTALDARLKKRQSPRILHLATHGFFLEDQKRDLNEERLGLGAMSFRESGMERLTASRLENPLLRSGLVFAGVNTWLKRGELMEEAEDGLLTAEDVSGLDLLDTELVVLSACETGLGEVRVGEGVFGLRRAFVLAGAKTLVMSLWKVPDEQTRELMEDFYRRILGADGNAPQPRADALRDAQLAMKAKHPEPLYWGAFICQGDPGPLA